MRRQALAALSGNKYFTDKITAAEYVPAFLAATSPYMVYTDGSSIRLTYNVSVGLPEEVTESARSKEPVGKRRFL